MTIIYLAGPIGGCSDGEIHGWREYCKRLAPEFFYEDPSNRIYKGREHIDFQELVEKDLIQLKRSDIVLINWWRPHLPSVGTAMEMAYGRLWAKKVVIVHPDAHDPSIGMHPWILYHATEFYSTLGGALFNLKRQYGFVDKPDGVAATGG